MKEYVIRSLIFPVCLLIVGILVAGIALSGCATSKYTAPDGTVIENMAYKEQATVTEPIGGPKVTQTQKATIPVKDQTPGAIMNIINGILPWFNQAVNVPIVSSPAIK